MNPSEIEQRLKDNLGEDSIIEYKGVAKTGFKIDPWDLAREIAGFANSGGGTILLGVENDGFIGIIKLHLKRACLFLTTG